MEPTFYCDSIRHRLANRICITGITQLRRCITWRFTLGRMEPEDSRDPGRWPGKNRSCGRQLDSSGSSCRCRRADLSDISGGMHAGSLLPPPANVSSAETGLDRLRLTRLANSRHRSIIGRRPFFLPIPPYRYRHGHLGCSRSNSTNAADRRRRGRSFVAIGPARLRVRRIRHRKEFARRRGLSAHDRASGRDRTLCNQHHVPFVPRGAGTSLAGCLPVGGGVMIVLTRMKEILEINLRDRYAVVQPGVVNVWLTNALKGTGYHYAPIRRARAPARSAATWRRTPAGRTR